MKSSAFSLLALAMVAVLFTTGCELDSVSQGEVSQFSPRQAVANARQQMTNTTLPAQENTTQTAYLDHEEHAPESTD